MGDYKHMKLEQSTGKLIVVTDTVNERDFFLAMVETRS